MTTAKREKLTLSLPPDPAFAGLTHLATLHFFRQNGVAPLVARRSASTVRARSRSALKAGARQDRRKGAAIALVLTCGGRTLEAVLRPGVGGATRPLVRVQRPVSA